MKLSRLKKTLIVIIFTITGLVLLLVISLDLPVAHRLITRKINKILLDNDIPFHIGSVRIALPGSFAISGIILTGSGGDTIVYAREVQASIVPAAAFKKKIIFSSVYIGDCRINITSNNRNKKLNIEEAFSGIKQTQVNPAEKKKKPWEISIVNLDLSGIRFRMQDSLTGLNIDQKIKEILVEIGRMSLPDKSISIRSLKIDGATGIAGLDPHPKDSTGNNSGFDWNIGLQKLTLNKIHQVFNDKADRISMDVNIGAATIKISNSDLNNKKIVFDRIFAGETSLTMLSDNKTVTPDDSKTGASPFQWSISGNELEFEKVSFGTGSYTDSTADPVTPGFSIADLNMSISDIKITKDDAALKANKASFVLGNGFRLKKLKGSLDSHSGETRLKLSAETGNSILNLEGSSEGDIFNIFKSPSRIRKAGASIRNTSLSLYDLFYFKPALKEKPLFNLLSAKPVNIAGDFRLIDSAITMADFNGGQDHNFGITMNGKITGIFPPSNPAADLQFAVTDINPDWLNTMLKVSEYKKGLPELTKLELNGSLSDSLGYQHFTINLNSNLGDVYLAGAVDLKNDVFSVKSSVKNLKLNKLLDNKELGVFYGSAELNGSGIKQKPVIAGSILIDSLHFKDYTYTKMSIKCKLKQNSYDLSLAAHDPSLHIELNSMVNTADSVLSLTANGNFSTRLNDIHLTKDTVAVEGTIKADLQMGGGNLESDVNISGLKLSTTQNSSTISNLNASFKADHSSTTLSAESDFFDVRVRIEKPLSALGEILKAYKEYAGSFINPRGHNADNRVSFLPEMSANIIVNSNDELRVLLQDTTIDFSNLRMALNINPGTGKLNCNLFGSNVRFKELKTDNLKIIAADSAGIMKLNTSAMNCTIFNLPVNKFLLTSRIEGGNGSTSISVLGKKDIILYNLDFSSLVDSNAVTLSIPSKHLTLNGTEWKTDSTVLFSFDRIAQAVSSSVKMSTKDSFLKLLADNQSGVKNYKVNLSNVTLASLLPDGIISGNPSVSVSGSAGYSDNKNKGIEVNSDLKFKDLRWSDMIIRNLSLKETFKSGSPEEYSLDAAANTDSANITLMAVKPLEGKRTIKAEFNNVPIMAFQPFVKDILSDLKGYISGNIIAMSKNEIENFRGRLNINKANVRINILNSSYRIPDDSLLITGEKLVFNKFIILDSLNNELLVDGSLNFGNGKSISTDLEITSSKLQVMNKTEKENSSLYGKIFTDTHLFVKGPLLNPEIKGKIILTGGTDIFFSQQENLSLTESEKVVTFVKKNLSAEQKRPEQTVNPNLLNETAVEALVEIDPATKLNFSLSKKLYNISIMIQGGGELNFNMMANNQLDLAGKYVIEDGTADVKMTGWPNKTFRIVKGGSIRWDGKIEDPELQFEAVNKVRSSYTNPVDNKQRDVDFNVTLKLSNRLSALDVLFYINTPDQYLMSIINTLSPEEQMRQAITILLFAKVDLPGISTSSDYMTEQVNQLIATQLNQLTKTTIKGIDISFGLDSYMQTNQTGGQETKTSLSYDVKKALFNNRAQIEISGRLNDVNKQPGASDLSLNNFSFEYQLDSAGTKFLKVYNEHSYEDVFEGEVIKTGVGLTYRKRYKTLGEIWRRENKKKKLKTQDK